MIDLEVLPDRDEDGRPRYRLTCAGRYVEGDLATVRAWFTTRGLPVPVLVDTALEGILTGDRPGLVVRLEPTDALVERLISQA